MDIRKLTETLAPLAALALVTTLGGCQGTQFSFDGEQGKPLSEVDLSGPAPHALALFGPDTVTLTPGDKLAITVEGEPEQTKELRFTLKQGTLGIARRHASWGWGAGKDGAAVTVHVTMPPPDSLAMAGSGKIIAPAVAQSTQVSIAGSGDIATPSVAAARLEVNIAGSGKYRAGGHVAALEINIAGSGNADLDALKAESATLSIAGSGGGRFASDGKVSASIMGSGEVRVRGRAHCTVSAVGSGKLICEPGDGHGTKADADEDDDSDNADNSASGKNASGNADKDD